MSFLDAIDKLPPFGGISFRGVPGGAVELPPVSIASGVMPSSKVPRLASENFSSGGLLVLLNRTGRDISMLSDRPEDGEVVIRPGSAWNHLVTLQVDGCPPPVLIIEELAVSGETAPPENWGATLTELAENVARIVGNAVKESPVLILTPGRYCGPWQAQPYTRSPT